MNYFVILLPCLVCFFFVSLSVGCHDPFHHCLPRLFSDPMLSATPIIIIYYDDIIVHYYTHDIMQDFSVLLVWLQDFLLLLVIRVC